MAAFAVGIVGVVLVAPWITIGIGDASWLARALLGPDAGPCTPPR